MTDILSLDDNQDKFWVKLIFKHCDMEHPWGELTKDILNKHIDEIVYDIFDELQYDTSLNFPLFTSLDSIMIGFQVLGVYILETGARLPDVVKHSILFSTEWDYDKWRDWSSLYEEERKENLRKFREAIINHKEGKKIQITF